MSSERPLPMPNVEAIVVRVLLQDDAVQAACDGRVYGELPRQLDGWPAVRVSQWGGQSIVAVPPVLEVATIQIDVWGGAKSAAASLAELCRNALACAGPGVYDDGCVSRVTCTQKAFQPDTVYKPARPRYRFDAALTIKPLRRVEA